MKRLIAAPEGAGQWSGNPAFRNVLANVVSQATRAHEREVMNTHKVLAGPSWRETVRIVNA